MIRIVNFLFLYKFCEKYDEMSETYWGGYSVCDCFSMLCPCWCYKRQPYEDEAARLAKEAKDLQDLED